MSHLCLAPPLLPAHAVLRPGLVRELERASRRQLTLLVAPPGAGKTVLLGQWATAHDHQVAWVRPEPGSGTGHIARAFVEAVDGVLAGTAVGLDELADPDGTRLGRRFLAAFAQATTALPPVVVVVDSIDALPGEVDGDLVALAELLPPQVRLVLAGQRRPAASLHRLRARGELSELTGELLRFTDEETAAVLAAGLGRDPDRHELGVVQRRTDGHAATVTLAAAALRAETDPTGLLARLEATPDGADGAVTVLWTAARDALAAEDRRLLETVAQLDRAPVALVEAVVSGPDARARLDALTASAPELLEADLDQADFHLHPLVVDRLRRDGGAVAVDLSPTTPTAAVLREAARWHRQRGESVAAARYLHRAEAWSDLTALVAEEHARPAGHRLPARWAAAVSIPHLLAQPADAAVVVGALAAAGDLDGARRVTRLLGDLRPRPAWLPTVDGLLDLLAADRAHEPDAVLANCDRIEAAVRDGGDLLPPAPRAPGLDRSALAATAALWRGRARLQQGRPDDALVSFAAARRASDPALARIATFEQALTLAWTGRLGAAEQNAAVIDADREADLDAALDPGRSSLAVELALTRAIVALARGDVDDVEPTLARASAGRVPGWSAAAMMWDALLRAEAALVAGDLDAAAAFLAWDERDEQTAPIAPIGRRAAERRLLLPPLLADQRAALAARVELARGQVSAARLALREGPQLTGCRLVTAMVGIATRDLDGARRELQALGGVADRHRRERDVLVALLHHDDGDDVAARHLVLETAERCAAEGDLRPFLLPGTLALPLLRRVAAADTTGLIGAALEHLDRRDGPAVRAPALNPVVASLSRRELELLPLLPTHLTVSDIAERLYISTNTAKTHLRHIYRKLGVGNRRAAVSRATELGLIEGWRA